MPIANGKVQYEVEARVRGAEQLRKVREEVQALINVRQETRGQVAQLDQVARDAATEALAQARRQARQQDVQAEREAIAQKKAAQNAYQDWWRQAVREQDQTERQTRQQRRAEERQAVKDKQAEERQAAAEQKRLLKEQQDAQRQATAEGKQRLRDQAATIQLNARLSAQADKEAAAATRAAVKARQEEIDRLRLAYSRLRAEVDSNETDLAGFNQRGQQLINTLKEMGLRADFTVKELKQLSDLQGRIEREQNSMAGVVNPVSLSGNMAVAMEGTLPRLLQGFQQMASLSPSLGAASSQIAGISSAMDLLVPRVTTGGAAMNTAGTAAQFLGAGAAEAGAGIGVAGGAAGVAGAALGVFAVVLAGATLAANKAVTEYANLEYAIAKVSTLTEKTPAQLEGTGRAILNMSRELGLSYQDLANGLYDVLGASVRGTEDMNAALDFTKEAAKLAVAGATDTATATNVLTSVMNAYKLSAKDTKSVSDGLFRAVQDGKMSLNDLALSIGMVTAISADLGVPLPVVNAALATMTANGIRASSAVDYLRSAFSSIQKPSSEAATLAGKLNLQFNAQALASKGLVKFLEDVIVATKGNKEQMAILFGGIEALSAVTSIASGNFDRMRQNLENQAKAAGTTETAYGKMAGKLKKENDKLDANWKSLWANLGSYFAPFKADVLGFMNDALEKLNRFIERAQLARNINKSGDDVLKWQGERKGQVEALRIGEAQLKTTTDPQMRRQLAGQIESIKGVIRDLDAKIAEAKGATAKAKADQTEYNTERTLQDLNLDQKSAAAAFFNAIFQQESGGRYDAFEPNYAKGGQGALGKYQVMPQNLLGMGWNVPQAQRGAWAVANMDSMGVKGKGWDYEVLGKDVTPRQFLNSPEMQEAVSQARMAANLQKRLLEAGGNLEVAVKEAAKDWYGRVAPAKGPTPDEYAASIWKRFQTQAASGATMPTAPPTPVGSTGGTPAASGPAKSFAEYELEARRILGQIKKYASDGPNPDGQKWTAANNALKAFTKDNELAAQAVAWVQSETRGAARTVSQYGQAYDTLKGQLGVAESLDKLGRPAVEIAGKYAEIQRQALAAAQAEKTRNGETEKYRALLDLAGDSAAKLKAIQERKPEQTPLQRDQQAQREAVAQATMLRELRSASSKRLTEIVAGGVTPEVSLEKWRAAQAEIDRRTKEADQQQDRSARKAAEINELSRQGKIQNARLALDELQGYYDAELKVAGTSAVKRLAIEQKYADLIYNAKKTILDREKADADADVKNKTDLPTEIRAQQLRNNFATYQLGLQRAEAEREGRIVEAQGKRAEAVRQLRSEYSRLADGIREQAEAGTFDAAAWQKTVKAFNDLGRQAQAAGLYTDQYVAGARASVWKLVGEAQDATTRLSLINLGGAIVNPETGELIYQTEEQIRGMGQAAEDAHADFFDLGGVMEHIGDYSRTELETLITQSGLAADEAERLYEAWEKVYGDLPRGEQLPDNLQGRGVTTEPAVDDPARGVLAPGERDRLWDAMDTMSLDDLADILKGLFATGLQDSELAQVITEYLNGQRDAITQSLLDNGGLAFDENGNEVYASDADVAGRTTPGDGIGTPFDVDAVDVNEFGTIEELQGLIDKSGLADEAAQRLRERWQEQNAALLDLIVGYDEAGNAIYKTDDQLRGIGESVDSATDAFFDMDNALQNVGDFSRSELEEVIRAAGLTKEQAKQLREEWEKLAKVKLDEQVAQLNEISGQIQGFGDQFGKMFGGSDEGIVGYATKHATLGIQAFTQFMKGDFVGMALTAIQWIDNIGEAIYNLSPGFKAWKKGLLEVAEAQKAAAGSKKINGWLDNPYSSLLQEDAAKREQLANATWWQRAWWGLFGGAPEVMEEGAAKLKITAAEIFNGLGSDLSSTMESELMNAFDSGDWSQVDDAVGRQIDRFIAKTTIQAVLAKSRLKDLIQAYAEESAAGGDTSDELAAIRSEANRVTGEVEGAVAGLPGYGASEGGSPSSAASSPVTGANFYVANSTKIDLFDQGVTRMSEVFALAEQMYRTHGTALASHTTAMTSHTAALTRHGDLLERAVRDGIQLTDAQGNTRGAFR